MEVARLVDRVIKFGAASDHTNRTALASPSGAQITYGQLAERITVGLDDHSGVEFVIASPTLSFVERYLNLSFHGVSQILLPEGLSLAAFQRLLRAYQPAAVNGLDHELARLGLPTEPLASSGTLSRVTLVNFTSVNQPVTGQVLLLTSGSTGSPKTVRLSPRNIASNTADVVGALSITPEDVAVTSLPLSYTYGLSVLHTHLWAGAATVCCRADPLQKGFRELLEHYSVSSIAGVPFSYSVLDRVGLIDKPTQNLKKFTQAGGRMDPKTAISVSKRLANHKAGISLMYGQTEATARISILPASFAQERPDSVGYVVSSGTLAIGSANHEDEIVFRGPNVMLGYAENAQALGQTDQQDGVLETGDLGKIEDDLLTITGRLKRIIKLSGVRVNLDFIEERLRSLGEVAVTPGRKTIVVHYVESGSCSADSLVALLKDDLGLYSRDITLACISEIPRHTSGKVNYQELSTNG